MPYNLTDLLRWDRRDRLISAVMHEVGLYQSEAEDLIARVENGDSDRWDDAAYAAAVADVDDAEAAEAAKQEVMRVFELIGIARVVRS